MPVKTLQTHRVECDACGEFEDWGDMTLEEACKKARDAGWEIAGNTCMCPACIYLYEDEDIQEDCEPEESLWWIERPLA